MNANKKNVYCAVLTLSSILIGQQSVLSKSSRWVVDTIVARVNGVNILKSDLEKPQIAKDGAPYKLDEALMEEMYLQRAVEMKISPSAADINRQITAIKIQNNLTHLTDDEFEEQLKEENLSLDQYKLQLGRIFAVENVKRAEVQEKLLVTSQEVERYCTNNPVYSSEGYHLQLARFSQEDVNDYKELIRNKKVSWQDLGWITKDEIASQYNVVFGMNKKTISRPIEGNDGFSHVIRLMDKRDKALKSLDERYGEIERYLTNEKRSTYFETFQEDMSKKMTIVFP